ncbi:MAG: MotA/TolQ/ExbB proton channel family protein [Methylococcaceae bacterium]|nr:MotA/TolQ/ExbB proton channel family protein [Methylococcaceae bacterium]
MNFTETTIVDGTLCLLGCFSLVTWSVILLKAGENALNRYRNHRVVQQFKGKPLVVTLSGYATEAEKNQTSQASRVLLVGTQTYAKSQQHPGNLMQQHTTWHELIERALRQQLQQEKALMDSGLGWLASIGSTAPFIGLFGTVWGIRHALKDISIQGNASLEVVAGPIGEALIATALGIAVAIPAVLGYNFFLRQNRQQLASLEHVGNDFLRSCIENDLITHTPEQAHVPTAI